MTLLSRIQKTLNGPVAALKTAYEIVWPFIGPTILSIISGLAAATFEPIARYGWAAITLVALLNFFFALITFSLFMIYNNSKRLVIPMQLPNAKYFSDSATDQAHKENELKKAQAIERSVFFLEKPCQNIF